MSIMSRRGFLGGILGSSAAAGSAKANEQEPSQDLIPEFDNWQLSDEEWKERLSEDQYFILRQEGTERPGSSPLNEEKREGVFACSGCGLELFRSNTKYESGTGWPSFFDYIPNSLGFKTDYKLVWPRKEYHCARCGGHQGHVFEDGPREETGLRYCNNGVALKFIPQNS